MKDELANKIKHLFPNDSDELEEEVAFSNNCRSKLFMQAKLYHDLSFKLSSIKLTSSPNSSIHNNCDRMEEGKVLTTSEGTSFLKNTLAYEDWSSDAPLLFKDVKFLKKLWLSKLTRPIFLLILNYIIAKYMLLSFFHYQLSSTLKTWHPFFHSNVSRTEKCVQEDDLPKLPEKATVALSWLAHLSDPTSLLDCSPVQLFQVMSVFPLFLYEISIFLMASNNYRFDAMSFLWNPLSEKQRIQAELNGFALKMIHVIKKMQNDYLKSHRYMSYHLINITNKFAIDGNVLCHLMHLTRYVKPSNLTPRWHTCLLKLSILYYYGIILSLISGWSLILSIIIVNTNECVLQRLDMFECERWLPKGTLLLKQAVRLDEVRDLENIKSYKNYDGSLASYIYLALFVEIRYGWNWRKIISMFELFCLIPTIIFWILNYQLTFAIGISDRLRWQSQVYEQLNCCVTLYSQLDSFKLKYDQKQISNILTITYYNYALFQSQNSTFLKLAKALTIPMLLGTCWVLTASYLIATYSENKLQVIVLIAALSYSIVVNAYMISLSILFSRSCRMVGAISRLISYNNDIQTPEEQVIFHFWKAHLVTSDELESLYSVTFLGKHVSLSYTARVNVYLSLLWIILFKLI